MLQYIGAVLYLAGSVGVLYITEVYSHICSLLWIYCLTFLLVLFVTCVFNIFWNKFLGDAHEKLLRRLFLIEVIFILTFGYTVVGTMEHDCYEYYMDKVPSLMVLFTGSLGSFSIFSIRFITDRTWW